MVKLIELIKNIRVVKVQNKSFLHAILWCSVLIVPNLFGADREVKIKKEPKYQVR
jgi:hypothetical protein